MANREWLTKGADSLHFYERLGDLIADKKTNATAVSKETGIAQSAMSEYLSSSKNRAPDCATIIALARYFSVSTDYLLGLTNVKTPATETQAIVTQTGLSEENVCMLEYMQSVSMSEGIALVNDLLALALDSDIIIHYLMAKTTLDLPNPSSWYESEEIELEDLAFAASTQRKTGYVQLAGKEALEYHCSKIADEIEQALIDKYKAVAKWGEKNGDE